MIYIQLFFIYCFLFFPFIIIIIFSVLNFLTIFFSFNYYFGIVCRFINIFQDFYLERCDLFEFDVGLEGKLNTHKRKK